MPRIDFYILTTDGTTSRLAFACQMIEKAYRNHHRIFVHTDQSAVGHALDELLWTYRADSFLPHHIQGDGPKPAPPIQIGIQTQETSERDILVNLSDTIPSFFTQFSRVIEIVSSDEATQSTKREHYRQYRAQGHNITTHKLQHSVDV